MLDAFYRLLVSAGFTDPVHPTQVHIPIGLVVGAVLFGIIAKFFTRSTLAATAKHCLILALLFWFPTVAAGVMDWQHFYGGIWLPPVKIKMGLAAILLVFHSIGVLVGRRSQGTSYLLLTIYAVCFFIVIALGYFGGKLVYAGRSSSVPKDLQTGQALFLSKCSACHPHGTNVIRPEKPMRGSSKLCDFNTFLAWIRAPVYPMPTFSPKDISDGQARGLYSFISAGLE
jgi:uncharacterized membrane protein